MIQVTLNKTEISNPKIKYEEKLIVWLQFIHGQNLSPTFWRRGQKNPDDLMKDFLGKNVTYITEVYFVICSELSCLIFSISLGKKLPNSYYEYIYVYIVIHSGC